MKKSLLVLALLSVVGSASAYKLEIENTSDFTIKAEIGFGDLGGICPKKQFSIDPHTTKKHQTDGCCMVWIRVSTTGYKGGDPVKMAKVGKWADAIGRSPVLRLSCRDNSFRVIISDTGDVTIENK